MDCLVHDLLQISEVSDLVYIGWELLPASPTPISTISENVQSAAPRARFIRQRLEPIKGFGDDRTTGDSPGERCPLWVEHSLQEAPFVVVRRAKLLEGMIPVGVRGSLRSQRYAAYLGPESIRNRITPEQLLRAQEWLTNARSEEVLALKVLADLEEKLLNFPLTYGPIGSIGFELASGYPMATSASDLDLLIRVPERLSMQLAQELVTIFSGNPCRVDAQLETPRGAAALTEYASGQRPLLLRQDNGPVLVDDPWEFHQAVENPCSNASFCERDSVLKFSTGSSQQHN
jgi:phosphoribosyl-dephospho-CoA transferase